MAAPRCKLDPAKTGVALRTDDVVFSHGLNMPADRNRSTTVAGDLPDKRDDGLSGCVAAATPIMFLFPERIFRLHKNIGAHQASHKHRGRGHFISKAFSRKAVDDLSAAFSFSDRACSDRHLGSALQPRAPTSARYRSGSTSGA
jgi:hypothetical protein